MIEASAAVAVPAAPAEVYAALSDLDGATWLPGVRRLRRVGGPRGGTGARYEVEARMLGRELRGVLVCREALEPEHIVMALEDGLDLTIEARVTAAAAASSRVTLTARYSVGGGLAARAVERASAAAARREVEHALERFAARWDGSRDGGVG